MPQPRILRAAFVASAVALAQLGHGQPAAPARQQPQPVRDAYQGGWGAPATPKGKAEADALAPEAERFTAAGGTASLDRFRAQRNAALARGQGQLDEAARALLREEAERLAAGRPGSFEARLAAYYAEFPSPMAWPELDAAARLQPERPELLGPLLTQALRLGDPARLAPAARAMKALGEVAPGLYALADDLLRSVEREGILITAGEMDGFPVLVRQYAEGRRADVLVIDHRLLEDAAYRATAWRQARATGPMPASADDFVARLHRATVRPVFLSLALGRAVAGPHAALLHVTGLALRMSEGPCCAAEALAATWQAMRKTTEAGPLSRNYLVPASALLKHYRATGDERRAAELEHELRQLAARLGATRELQASGILPH